MRIVIVGDCVPTKQTMDAFIKQDIKSLFGDLSSFLESADVAFLNLECALTESNTMLKKDGPCFKASPFVAETIRKAGFTHVGMANNHMKDFCEQGVLDTIMACNETGLMWIGAGTNLQSMVKIRYIMSEDVKIGIYAVADNEFSAATDNEAGANCFDEYQTRKDIEEYSNQCDVLIVIYHSGLELYAYQTPDLARRCHAMVDSGANYIVCQHSHCIGTIEKYKESLIIYGQGNFHFSIGRNVPEWYECIMFVLDINNGKQEYTLIPLQLINGTVYMNPSGNNIIQKLEARNNAINEGKMDELFQQEIKTRAFQYYSTLLSLPRLLWIANKLSKNMLGRLLYRKSQKIRMLNAVRCETHRELLEACLK